MSAVRAVVPALLLSACAATDDAPRGVDETPATAVAPSAAARALVHQVSLRFARERSAVVAAPVVRAFDGEAAHVEVLSTQSYVRDIDVRAGAAGAVAAPQPVEGTLATGLRIAVLAQAVRLRPGCVAVAFDVAASGLAVPSERRSLRTAAPPSAAVEIELPRVETTAFAGALVLELGREVRIASFPDGGGAISVTLRVDADVAAVTPARAASPDDPGDRGAKGDDATSLLRALARAACTADGLSPRVVTFGFEEEGRAPSAFLCGTVASPGEGLAADPSKGGDRSMARSLTTVVAPGAHIERRLEAAHVAAWDVRGASIDPAIVTHASGCDVTMGEDGKFHVRWTATPQFLTASSEPLPGLRAEVERPISARAAAATPIVVGDTELPMGSFTGTAGATVHLTCSLAE